MLFCKSTTISQSQETKENIDDQTNLAAASGTRQKVPEVAAVRLPWLHVMLAGGVWVEILGVLLQFPKGETL
jgi:hypothetical protein